MTAARIYLDYAATTPLRLEARAAMEPYLSTEAFGNPSSLHADGQRAKRALDSARDVLAHALGAQFSEIAFTSGGTEADNAALVGVMLACRGRGDHLITTQIEHEAVLRTARFLETLGFRVTYLAPDEHGGIHPDQVADALTDRTTLVSVMHASNEVGTLQPIREIAEIVHAHGAYLHTDAVQTFGQCPITLNELGADLITVSGHKIYGPKGVGVLCTCEGVPIEPWLHGGGQERDRRAGTENVAAIAGFAEATRLILAERMTLAVRLTGLRETFLDLVRSRIPSVQLNGHPTRRLPNNINISVPGIDAEAALLSLDMMGISASSGSACTAGSIEPSHVLLAMGLGADRARSALRFTLGRTTEEQELKHTADALARIAARI